MSRIKADVKVVNNAIGGRQGWAYVCNSGKIRVLKADMEKPQEYDTYHVFDKVNVAYSYEGSDRVVNGTLAWNDGAYEIGGHGCFLSSSFTYTDALELIENNNAQTVKADEVIAVAEVSKTTVRLLLFKLGRIDEYGMTIAQLIPLNDEEMQEVADDVQRWIDRY